MNHAHATRARSIINAHLIRRSSSALEIFTKVRTTRGRSVQKRNRRTLQPKGIPVRDQGRGMAAMRFAIHPDCHRTWRAAF